MVRFLARLASSPVRGLHQAAYLLALFALLSQILALVRDRLLAGAFGASQTLDVYFAAFRLPDLLFASVASLLSLYALMPAMSRLEQEGEGYAASFLRQSLLVFFATMAVVSAVAFAFACGSKRRTCSAYAHTVAPAYSAWRVQYCCRFDAA